MKGHFYRELKLIDTGEIHKKRKYIYFDDMEFMRPHCGFKLTPMKYASHKSMDHMDDGSMYEEIANTEDVETNNDEDVANNSDDIDMEALLKTNDLIEEVGEDEEEELEKTENISAVETRNLRPKRNIKSTPKAIQNQASSPPLKKPKLEKESVFKNVNVIRKNSAPTSSKSAAGLNSTLKIRDGDISFSMSLVPTLRTLNEGKKLRAKIEILRVLHKYTDIVERSRLANKSSSQNQNNSNQFSENNDETDMQEDHLEDFEEDGGGGVGVSVKNETSNDPLNGNSGGNKTWWN